MNNDLPKIKAALEYHWKHQDKLSYDVLKEKIEGFEKELREVIKNYSVSSDEWERGFAMFLKEEILGE